jgi:tetratricopeptide (TPR) repeat protein
MGAALKDKGEIETAIDSYQQALKNKPDYADAYYNMGDALQKKGDLGTAIDNYKQALKIKPDHAEAYCSMGNALQDKGDLETAIDSYQQALKIKPDHAEACARILKLLTYYAPVEGVSDSNILYINQEIKNIDIQDNTSNIISDDQIVNLCSKSSNYISSYGLELRTKLSQTYRNNTIDLNCQRHFSIFNEHDIIPEFCFGCYKVQVEPRSIIDLIKLYVVFDQLELNENNNRKCMVELRPEIPGFYKGLIYCSGLKQANQIAEYLNRIVKKNIGSKLSAKVKRGCSEYPLSFPDYKEINNFGPQLMNYTDDWKVIEDDHDRKNSMKAREDRKSSLPGLNLNDVLIIQKWIDYARGIGDSSVDLINQNAVLYQDIYNLAKARLSRYHFTN